MKVKKHAAIRISERSGLTSREVCRMIRAGVYIPIGIHSKKKNVHKLIYSHHDDMCYIAVHDEDSDEIVTVLPIDYHNAWEIDIESAIEETKNLYRIKVLKENVLITQKGLNSDDALKLWIFFDIHGTIISVGSIDARELNEWGLKSDFTDDNVRQLFKDKNNISKLSNRIVDLVCEQEDDVDTFLKSAEDAEGKFCGSLYFRVGYISINGRFQLPKILQQFIKDISEKQTK